MYISGMFDGAKILAATSVGVGLAAGGHTGSAIAAKTDGNLVATGGSVAVGGATALFAASKFSDATFKTSSYIGIPGAIGFGAALAISGAIGGVAGLGD